MTPQEIELLNRIKFNPQVLAGAPIILGPAKRILMNGDPPGQSQEVIPVWGILQQLSIGGSYETIKANNPWVEREDVEACKLWWRKMQEIDTAAVQQIME